MFEQSIIAGAPRKRRAWTVSVSVAGQIFAVGVAILIPVVAYDHLPAARLTPRLGVPQPPVGKAKRPPDHVKVEAVRWQQRNGVFTEPVNIPKRVEMVVDPVQPPDTVDDGTSVVGGIEGPGTGGDNVIGSILTAAARQAQPAPPPVAAPQEAAPVKPQITRVRMGGHVLEAKLIHRVVPAYPAHARLVRASGDVRLSAVIGRDGRIQEINVLSGHPLLIQAAVDAVRQWIYQPTMLNGEPVEVDTVITVMFNLAR
jgi:protein TonB